MEKEKEKEKEKVSRAFERIRCLEWFVT